MTFIYVTHDQEEALTMSDRIAVMKGGQIDQLAPPVEIYNRPRTRFVADFIGDTNLLSGTVHGDYMLVNGSKIPLQDGAEVIPGERAYLSIRPEMVTVHTDARAPGDEARPSLEGTVEETIFMGSVWKTIVKLPGGSRIVASEPPSSHGYIAPGTAVSVVWEAERAVLLPE
jgi:ABC-type Fe3+/spermidine/putrescine transport system ATPase subunit